MATTVDKSNARVRRMFGQIAPRYDRLNHVLSMNVDRYWRWKTVRLVPPRGTSPILDVCTGTGDLALAYARAAEPQTPIVAADFCREMLDVGQRKREAAPQGKQITFVEADAQQLPFDEDLFQIVCVAFGLRNVADTDAGLRELTRVCQPGGTVAVLEFSMPQRQPIKAFYGWYFRNVLPQIGKALAANAEQAYDYLPQSVGEFPSGEALAVRMREAGLRDIVLRPFTFGVATLYTGRK